MSEARNSRRSYLRGFVDGLKSKTPCADCKVSFHPQSMDFDHVTVGDKTGEVSRMITNTRSLDNIIKEISKCQLVCATCHRLRTFKRGHRKPKN